MLLTYDEIYSLCDGLQDVSTETWLKITKNGGWYEQYDGMEENRDNIPNYTTLRGWMCEALLVAWQFTFGEILYVFNDKGQILPEIDTNYKSKSGHSIVDGFCILFKDGTLLVNSSKIKDVGSLGVTASDVNNLLAVADTIVSKLPNMVKQVIFYVCSASAWSPQAIDLINAHILRKDHYYLKTILLDEREEKENFNEKHNYLFMKDVCRTIGIFLDDYGYKFPKYDEIHHSRKVLSVTQFNKRNEIVEKFKAGEREVLLNADCRTGKTCISESIVDKLEHLNIGSVVVIFGNFPGNNDQMIKKICDYDENINCGVVKPNNDYDKFIYNPDKKNIALLSAQMVSISTNDETKPCVKELIDLKPVFLMVDEAHYGIGSDIQRIFLKYNFNCPILYLTGTADTFFLSDKDKVTLNDIDIYKNMAEDSETYLDKNKHKRSVRCEIKMPPDFDVAVLEADIAHLENGSYDKQTIENQRKEALELLLSQVFNTWDITDNHNAINDVFKNQRTGKGILKPRDMFINVKVALIMVQTIKSQDIWNNTLKQIKDTDLYESLVINSVSTPGSKAIILINDFIKKPSNKKKVIFVVKQCLIGADFHPGLDAVVNWTHKCDTISLTKQQGSNRSKTPIGENNNPVSLYMTPYKEEICKICHDDVYSMTHNGKNSIPEKIAQKLAVTSIVYKIFDKDKPNIEKAEDVSKIYDKMLDVIADYEIFYSFNVRTYRISGYIDDSKYSIEDLDIDNTGFKMPYVVSKETNEIITDKKGNPITYDKLCMDNKGNLLSFDDVKNPDKVRPVVMMETGRYIDNPKSKSNIDEDKLSKLGEELKKDLGYNHQFYQERVFWYTLEGLQALCLIYYMDNSNNLDVSYPNHKVLLEMVYDNKDLSKWFLSHKTYRKIFQSVDDVCSFLDRVYGLNNIDTILENWYNGIVKNEHIRRWIMNNRIYKREFGEVLTPKNMVDEMLDIENIDMYKDKNEVFIDNSFGTGNFLIEVIRRCMKYQEDDFQTEEERFEWIIKHRIFGIEIQERNVKLASLRPIYDDEKDIQRKFNPTLNYKNWWVESGHCVCADALTFDYSKFGDVEFNFVGNPPYQQMDGGGSGDSAIPIYNLFILLAMGLLGKGLKVKTILMIVPSRWMNGGKGLNKFRDDMMNDTHIKEIHDFADARKCFPDVHLDGGVCYFLWDKSYNGKVNYYYQALDGTTISSVRYLKNDLSNTIIRDDRQITILEKILPVEKNRFSQIVSTRNPYGLNTDLFNNSNKYPELNLQEKEYEGSCRVFGVRGKKGGAKRCFGYIQKDKIQKNKEMIEKYKLFFPKAYTTTSTVIPDIIIGKPNDVSTDTFLEVGPFESEEQAKNCIAYTKTKFFRALLAYKRGCFLLSRETFSFIPLLDFNVVWTDADLYKKYNLTPEGINYIENNVDPMV